MKIPFAAGLACLPQEMATRNQALSGSPDGYRCLGHGLPLAERRFVAYTGPMKDSFGHVTDWVFDLDNTLYPRHCDLFLQIDWRMTDYVARLTGLPKDEARKLQKQLYRDHGTTLNGLMAEYHIDPHEFLEDVHDIDYSQLDHNPNLGELILALPGRKHIFTNGDVAHAQNTLRAIGISDVFEGMFDIVAADFVPKPDPRPYEKFLSNHDVKPETAVMFEDMQRNLEVPKQLGMTTVLVVPRSGTEFAAEHWEIAAGNEKHIDHITDDIDAFLEEILRAMEDGSPSRF